MTAFDLSPDTIEAVAQRVAELMAPRIADAADDRRDELVDAREIARRFGVSRDTAYANAGAWGAIRLGTGPRARLRFDPQLVAERLGAEESPAEKSSTSPRVTRRRPNTAPAPELLPIRGRA